MQEKVAPRILPGFMELLPGETRTVEFTLPANDLAFVGYDGKWILEKGEFVIFAGNQSVKVECTETHKWESPNR